MLPALNNYYSYIFSNNKVPDGSRLNFEMAFFLYSRKERKHDLFLAKTLSNGLWNNKLQHSLATYPCKVVSSLDRSR